MKIPESSQFCLASIRFAFQHKSHLKMASIHRLNIFADYFQFVVMDERSTDDFSTLWTEEALERMIAVGHTAICPGTLRNVEVPVEVHILEREPVIANEDYNHIAEGSFDTPTGRLAVMGCTDFLADAHWIDVPPGNYQFLYCVTGIETIQEHWEHANDFYKLYLWLGEGRKGQLVKHWQQRGKAQAVGRQ